MEVNIQNIIDNLSNKLIDIKSLNKEKDNILAKGKEINKLQANISNTSLKIISFKTNLDNMRIKVDNVNSALTFTSEQPVDSVNDYEVINLKSGNLYKQFVETIRYIKRVDEMYFNKLMKTYSIDLSTSNELYISELISSASKLECIHNDLTTKLMESKETYDSKCQEIDDAMSENKEINKLLAVLQVLRYQTKKLNNNNILTYKKYASKFLSDEEIKYCDLLIQNNLEKFSQKQDEKPQIKQDTKKVKPVKDFTEIRNEKKKLILEKIVLNCTKIEQELQKKGSSYGNNKARICLSICSTLGEINSFNINDDVTSEIEEYLTVFDNQECDFTIINALNSNEYVYRFVILNEFTKSIINSTITNETYDNLINTFMNLSFIKNSQRFSVIGNEKFADISKLIEETKINEDYNKLVICYKYCNDKPLDKIIEQCTNMNIDTNSFLMYKLKIDFEDRFKRNIYIMDQNQIDTEMSRIYSNYRYLINNMNKNEEDNQEKLFNSKTKNYIVILDNIKDNESFTDNVNFISDTYNVSKKTVLSNLSSIANTLELKDIKSSHKIKVDSSNNKYDIKGYRCCDARLGLKIAKDVQVFGKPLIIIMGAVYGNSDGAEKNFELLKLYNAFNRNIEYVESVMNEFKISENQGCLTEKAQEYLDNTEKIYEQLKLESTRK